MLERKPLHLTIEQLRALVCYDPITGLLTRRCRQRKYPAGSAIGWVGSRGYLYAQVDGATYLGHRVAWAIHHGVWPQHDIDHRNRVRSNNWIDNLKEADQSINTANSVKTNATGFRGVSWHAKMQRFRARITINGRLSHLGYFDTAVEAAKAYDQAVVQTYGSDFPTNYNLGLLSCQ